MNAAARANVNVYALDPRGLIGMTTDLIDSWGPAPPITPAPTRTDPSALRTAAPRRCSARCASLRTAFARSPTAPVVSPRSIPTRSGSVRSHHRREQPVLPAWLCAAAASARRPLPPHRGQSQAPRSHRVARRGYPSPSGKTRQERNQDALERWARERRSGGENDTSPELRAAINSAVQQSGLTLAVQAVAFKGTAKASLCRDHDRARRPALEFAPQPNGLFADTLEVSFFALNDDGRAQRGTRAALNLAVRPETYQRVKTLGVRLNSRTPMAPGRYQLRVGARDPKTGKAGTVFYDLAVPDFSSKPLMMSGAAVVASAEGHGGVDAAARSRGGEAARAPADEPARIQSVRNACRGSRRFTTTLLRGKPKPIDVAARLIAEDGRDAFASRDVLTNGDGAPAMARLRLHWPHPAEGRCAGPLSAASKRANDRTRTNRLQTAQTVMTVRPSAH